MKKLIILIISAFISMNQIAQTNYDFLKNYSAVYVPDENTTYFTEQIEVQITENGEEIIMKGIVAKL